MCWGVADAPVSWHTHRHGFDFEGDHHVALTVLPRRAGSSALGAPAAPAKACGKEDALFGAGPADDFVLCSLVGRADAANVH